MKDTLVVVFLDLQDLQAEMVSWDLQDKREIKVKME
jgi:hypothetical protein